MSHPKAFQRTFSMPLWGLSICLERDKWRIKRCGAGMQRLWHHLEMDKLMKPNFRSLSAWVMLLAGISGFIASFVLTIDKFKVLKDSGFTPSCSINETLNCKSVMLSNQAEVFGFPNSLIGIATFAMMVVIAVALFYEIRFPRLFWQLLLVGTTLAVHFCHWLAYQTTFIIGALCPNCMVAWVATLLVLSVGIRELLEIKKESANDEDERLVIETIAKWMLPLHILWATLLVGAAFLGV